MSVTIDKEMLIAKAWEARERSYSPYSHFKVGAAVLGADGNIYLGANIENCSYGMTVCGERSAIFGMVNAGCLKFDAIAVVGGLSGDSAPCCACRQVLTEFCSSQDVPVFVAGPDNQIFTHTLAEIAPLPFVVFTPDVQ